MNNLFLNFDDGIDINAVYTKVKELFPSVKKADKIESATVLKEFNELSYKDHEMDVKFKFEPTHTVKMVYHGDEYVNINDEEFHIFAGDKTESGAIMEYIFMLDSIWTEYIDDYNPDTMGKGLIKRVDKIKSKVERV